MVLVFKEVVLFIFNIKIKVIVLINVIIDILDIEDIINDREDSNISLY